MFENVERLRDFNIPIIRLSAFSCFFVSGKTMMEVLSLCPWCLSDCSHIQIMSASFQSDSNMLNHETKFCSFRPEITSDLWIHR